MLAKLVMVLGVFAYFGAFFTLFIIGLMLLGAHMLLRPRRPLGRRQTLSAQIVRLPVAL